MKTSTSCRGWIPLSKEAELGDPRDLRDGKLCGRDHLFAVKAGGDDEIARGGQRDLVSAELERLIVGPPADIYRSPRGKSQGNDTSIALRDNRDTQDSMDPGEVTTIGPNHAALASRDDEGIVGARDRSLQPKLHLWRPCQGQVRLEEHGSSQEVKAALRTTIATTSGSLEINRDIGPNRDDLGHPILGRQRMPDRPAAFGKQVAVADPDVEHHDAARLGHLCLSSSMRPKPSARKKP
ncbi:TPA: hypothetical protein DDZ10_01245 [Candidatus Uhrbacteria bacterium]|nr:MAG: hypothetical protein A3D69_02805 [Candidatus Uhrbacteria bacterium RIFCSPHIGHO2_02_FULL_54_11]HBL39276.1 hypothetical protein [Candidatus Uhrbacteria bacterium]